METALTGLDFSPDINMARYLQNIRRFPLLSQEEEYELAVKYKETADKDIAYQLITSHLRLVVKVVSKYKGSFDFNPISLSFDGTLWQCRGQ